MLSPSVTTMLTALARKIDESRAEMDTQSIGNSLYSLKEHTGSAATEAVLKALARKIGESRAEISVHTPRS